MKLTEEIHNIPVRTIKQFIRQSNKRVAFISKDYSRLSINVYSEDPNDLTADDWQPVPEVEV